ncbi:MAG: Gfo/Idh/MocA family oxidoreductase [Opitutae bacterium]|nr:Gfo/Idh/MocA family oxidoreductase [Opitutae bacterium]
MMQYPEETLKGILVGCGFMGGVHAQVYKVLPDVEIVAAVDTRAASSEEKLKSLNCPAPVHTTLEEALAEHSCHFVDICLPTHLHEEFAVQAIQAMQT